MAEVLRLKKTNCKNCYKCIRYCPVKSIRFSGNQAHIAGEECILCGQCFVVCPQNAKEVVDETEKAKVLIQSRAPVFVSLAPSFAANYRGIGLTSMRAALQALGFHEVEETALGATIVKNEYNRILQEDKPDILITSCCHSVNLLVQMHFPAALPYLADVLSPMQAHCKSIKDRHPDAKVVFIGPCVAKKDEAAVYEGFADAVLTFEELRGWFLEKQIFPKAQADTAANGKARFFPVSGGVLETMGKTAGYTYFTVDGAENCIKTLKDIEKGGLHDCVIEMSACVGSCVGGPAMEETNGQSREPLRNYIAITNFAGKNDFPVYQPPSTELHKSFDPLVEKKTWPTDREITEILKKTGKNKPEDELNCGSCGYNTCREKATAVFHGKASVSMCLPFLKERAENFSDTIVSNSPNGLIVLNESLEVQQINKAACGIMNIRLASDVLGSPVIRILDPADFMQVLEHKRNQWDKKVYLAEYNRYVEQSILYDREYHVLICFLRDITDREEFNRKRENISRQTVETADKVVEKQMRIVQEIASLLGETSAETKIALTKLKESIQNE